ncbi:hypothetical protein [Amycolatopsis sp. PS_44_ISF1]|uniref:hypothetical protein n=1 Tax=Amycolatopsis sp. PS_44_ISF1 TaxID=2974917 RepID=UPI0028DEAF74|nr:hypothetical protein [Amycolatopsis sp. PS_44_ISF1]MDT8910209.1 hypothetical protein [Amycolatopsis sp. PS_44_ISF1]
MFEAPKPEHHLGNSSPLRLHWPDVVVVVVGTSFTMFLIARGITPLTAIGQATLSLTSFVAVVFVGRGLRNIAQGRRFIKNLSGVSALEPQIATLAGVVEHNSQAIRRLSDSLGSRWPDYPPGDTTRSE